MDADERTHWWQRELESSTTKYLIEDSNNSIFSDKYPEPIFDDENQLYELKEVYFMDQTFYIYTILGKFEIVHVYVVPSRKKMLQGHMHVPTCPLVLLPSDVRHHRPYIDFLSTITIAIGVLAFLVVKGSSKEESDWLPGFDIIFAMLNLSLQLFHSPSTFFCNNFCS